MAAKGQRPAVFLDRDGVLTVEKGYVDSVEKLVIFPYARKCVEQIHEKGYYAIVVTNQSGVARGLFTEGQLQDMNRWLMEWTGVDAVYYCPHHPEGKIEKYRQVCRCRKPNTGMLETACKDFEIDMEHSYLVGDRAGDILTGQAGGIKTILVESGYGSKKMEEYVTPDFIANDLRDVPRVLR